MAFKLSTKSLGLLVGVHPDLVKVVKRAIEITEVDFKITEGVRTRERQKMLVAKKLSTTMNSRHIPGPDGYAKAVDIAPLLDVNQDGKVSSEEMWAWPAFYPVADAFKAAAEELGVAIVWGGDWKTFKDGPHFELDRRVYP